LPLPPRASKSFSDTSPPGPRPGGLSVEKWENVGFATSKTYRFTENKNQEVKKVRYFWTPEARLPEGVGFSLFGLEHMSALGLILAASGLTIFLCCRVTASGRQRLLRILAVVMVALEIAKDLTLAVLDAYTIGYLPLHLCSMAMFICLYAAWHPHSRGAGQLVWSLCLPGAVAALLLPDWTDMPVLQFQSLHSFLYHALLVQFALVDFSTGQGQPRWDQTWKVAAFLAAVAIPVYWINCALGTNYMFLNRPVPGTPLMLCARFPGTWGYLLAYSVLVAVVVLGLEVPVFLWRRWRSAV
jgi:hypothetical integral membrane protein (TIGR02206 family)